MEPADMIKYATFGMLQCADSTPKALAEKAKIAPLYTGRNRIRLLHREIPRRRQKTRRIHLPLAYLLDFQYHPTSKLYLLRGVTLAWKIQKETLAKDAYGSLTESV